MFVFFLICFVLKLLLGFCFYLFYYMKFKWIVFDDVEVFKDSIELQVLNSNEILNDIEFKGCCDELQVLDRKEVVVGLGVFMMWCVFKFNFEYELMDVDIGIRFVQYVVLVWLVVDLVLYIFFFLNL